MIQLSGTAQLFHGDCRDALKALPANSVDSCVTDPPYHLNSIVKRFGADDAKPALSSAQRRFAESGGGDRPPGTDQFGRLSKGFMGKTWDGGDIAFQREFWTEIYRVLKPGAYIAAFGAPKNFGRLQVAILDTGFEERDCILNIVNPDDAVVGFLESLSETQLDAFFRVLAQSEMSGFLAWTFGSGFPKSHAVDKGIDQHFGARGAPKLLPNGREHHFNIGFGEGEGYDAQAAGRFGYVPATPEAAEWSGFGTALKPAFEPIVLARKPLSESTVAANVLRWRTGALNIDASRVGTSGGRKSEGGDKRTESQDGAIGAYSTSPIVPGLGRWPANICHDGSDEVVGAFPSAGGQLARARTDGTPQNNSVYGTLKHGTRNPEPRGDSGSAARFFYSAKASRADRAGSKHPTVKPIALMEWLCTLITPPGGTILDPFAGSGTTGVAATRRGFQVVLCEREAEYVADIQSRFNTPDDIRQKMQLIAAEFPDMEFKVRPSLVCLASVRAELALLPHLHALQTRLGAARAAHG